MKHAVVAVTILLLGSAAHAQSLAQPSVSHDCGSTTSCSVSLSNTVTVGNTLLAIVRMGTTNKAGTTISDNLGSSYALDAAVVQTIDGHSLAIYRAPITTAGTPTLTVSNSSASTARIVGFAEVAGLAAGAPDQVAAAIGSNNTPTAGTLSPTQANDYLLVAVSTADGETFTCSSGFVCEQTLSKGAFGDQDQTAAASISGSMSITSADQWAAVAIAYKSSPRVPLSLQLNYSDGTPVLGSLQLSLVSGTSTTLIASWPISSSGAVSAYLPLVTSGTYAYTAVDPTGKQLQGITVLPGAIATLGLHSVAGSLTLNKSTDTLMMPASLTLR
ncbi:MAG TPA: hypothetical protein VHX49_17665 [Candidatus Acidoferrales bacterium]|nr:hypothetical protein [Candidatus Acidoferrales bacterium]